MLRIKVLISAALVRGGPLIIQGWGWSENEKKIGPGIGSEKKNRAKIFEKIKNPTMGVMVKSEKKNCAELRSKNFHS